MNDEIQYAVISNYKAWRQPTETLQLPAATTSSVPRPLIAEVATLESGAAGCVASEGFDCGFQRS